MNLLDGDSRTAARALLGAVLIHAGVAVQLTETEAYAGLDDPGSHAYRGRTPRTEVMFGPSGRLYVYFIDGMHFCVNVVTGTEGEPGGVLLRAGRVLDGLELARERAGAPGPDHRLARGPARLARVLALTKAHNGANLHPDSLDSDRRAGLRTPALAPWISARGPQPSRQSGSTRHLRAHQFWARRFWAHQFWAARRTAPRGRSAVAVLAHRGPDRHRLPSRRQEGLTYVFASHRGAQNGPRPGLMRPWSKQLRKSRGFDPKRSDR